MPSSSSSSSLLFPAAEKPGPKRGSSYSSFRSDTPRTPIDENTPLMSAPQAAKKQRSRKSAAGRRSTGQLTKTEIRINVYDLLPPSRVSSILWSLGTSLLHSGVIIGDKEYAFGGHDQPGVSGVYWTRPRLEPPGGTFKLEILHGFSYLPVEDIEGIVREVSQKFQGPSYNLLTKNCNHFTSHLCHRLTSRRAPSWLNRAASIGVALPCLVPREWTDLEPPDHDTAAGELLDEESEEDSHDERAPMIRGNERENSGDEEPRRLLAEEDISEEEDEEHERRRRKSAALSADRLRRVSFARDTSGREMPAAERAPPPTIRIN